MYSHSTFQIFFSDANIIIIIYDHLWSATKHHLIVPRYRLSTFGRSLLCRWSDGLELATGQSP